MKVGVCLIVRDEEDYVAEWILHYFILGFDSVFIYDHGSVDRTATMVASCACAGDLRYFMWTPATLDPQIDAYNDCISRFGQEFEWLAFFDIDEMLIPPADLTIHGLLKEFPDANAIGINWLMFGSNGLEDKAEAMMMEAFTRRADYSFGANRNVKSIMRPSASSSPCNNPHWFPVKGNSKTLEHRSLIWCPEQEGVVQPEAIVQATWRLHHYYTRGRKMWRKRLARGQLGGLIVPDSNYIAHDRNEIIDESALISADLVRRKAADLHVNLMPR